MHLRLMGFVLSIVALILGLVWFGWKLTLFVWLALWANNLTMAAKFGKTDTPTFNWEEE